MEVDQEGNVAVVNLDSRGRGIQGDRYPRFQDPSVSSQSEGGPGILRSISNRTGLSAVARAIGNLFNPLDSRSNFGDTHSTHSNASGGSGRSIPLLVQSRSGSGSTTLSSPDQISVIDHSVTTHPYGVNYSGATYGPNSSLRPASAPGYSPPGGPGTSALTTPNAMSQSISQSADLNNNVIVSLVDSCLPATPRAAVGFLASTFARTWNRLRNSPPEIESMSVPLAESGSVRLTANGYGGNMSR